MLYRLLILTGILCCSGVADANTIVKEKTTYYSVSAFTKDKLLPALNKATPIREDGDVFHGYTHSQIQWNYRWWETKTSCKITKVEVTANIKFTLPTLKNASAEVFSLWGEWYPKLVVHAVNSVTNF